jgi:hypothetical protein
MSMGCNPMIRISPYINPKSIENKKKISTRIWEAENKAEARAEVEDKKNAENAAIKGLVIDAVGALNLSEGSYKVVYLRTNNENSWGAFKKDNIITIINSPLRIPALADLIANTLKIIHLPTNIPYSHNNCSINNGQITVIDFRIQR